MKTKTTNYQDIIKNELKIRTDLLEKLLKEKGYTIKRQGNVLHVERNGKAMRAEFSQKRVEYAFVQGGIKELRTGRYPIVRKYHLYLSNEFGVDKAKQQKAREQTLEAATTPSKKTEPTPER